MAPSRNISMSIILCALSSTSGITEVNAQTVTQQSWYCATTGAAGFTIKNAFGDNYVPDCEAFSDPVPPSINSPQGQLHCIRPQAPLWYALKTVYSNNVAQLDLMGYSGIYGYTPQSSYTAYLHEAITDITPSGLAEWKLPNSGPEKCSAPPAIAASNPQELVLAANTPLGGYQKQIFYCAQDDKEASIRFIYANTTYMSKLLAPILYATEEIVSPGQYHVYGVYANHLAFDELMPNPIADGFLKLHHLARFPVGADPSKCPYH